MPGPLAGVLRPPGPAAGTALARRAARTYRASASRSAWSCPAFKSITCSVPSSPKVTVPSPSASLLMRYRKDQRVVRMVNDSDPRTLAEYVTQCPKIFVR